MMEELPGILVRLVQAWQRRQERGRWLDTGAEVRAEFEQGSDRVRLWFAERCRITTRPDGTAPVPGQTLSSDRVTRPRFLAQMFNAWAQEQHAPPMGERKIIERLTSINGVERVQDQNKVRGLNIIAYPVGQDLPDDVGAEGAETGYPFPPRENILNGSGGERSNTSSGAGAGYANSAPSAPVVPIKRKNFDR